MKVLIVAAVLVGASLAPVAVEEAQARCKSGLTNKAERWWAWGKVVTQWCYRRGHVISRHSSPSQGKKAAGYAWGFQDLPLSTGFTYSECHDFNGYWNHNCLTRYQVSHWSRFFGVYSFCIHTRIYGNGRHRRRVTDGDCP
jgi:hypothetical protein